MPSRGSAGCGLGLAGLGGSEEALRFLECVFWCSPGLCDWVVLLSSSNTYLCRLRVVLINSHTATDSIGFLLLFHSWRSAEYPA